SANHRKNESKDRRGSPGGSSTLVNNKKAGSVTSSTTTATKKVDQEDELRKHFERLTMEVQEAHQEVDHYKKRQDWALMERDKIVLERESIRTLCDKLRRERDRKVSDLAEALRESDEIKRQK